MHFESTKYCSVNEICDLQTCKSAEEAMIAFCEQQLQQTPVFTRRIGEEKIRTDEIYPFYLFSAAVESASNPYGTKFKRYGHEFAAFIKKHKLGEVWESPQRNNTTFHPDHDNVIWIWTPDTKAIKAWWRAKK